MVKKVRLTKTELNKFVVDSNKEYEEDKWKNSLMDLIRMESYLGAFLMLQEKLRQQAKNNQLIEDKRTETLN